MQRQIRITNTFRTHLKKVIKKYPKSEALIQASITGLSSDHPPGDSYAGLSVHGVYKLRIGLPEYKIGKSGGLRLIFIAPQKKPIAIPLIIYKKGLPKREHDVQKNIRSTMRKLHAELKSG